MQRGIHAAFNERTYASYDPRLERRCLVLLSQMLQKPDDWERLYRRFTTASGFDIVYGLEPTDFEMDGIAEQVRSFMERIARATIPGSFLVDFFPSMLNLPPWIAKWKRDGLQWYQEADSMLEKYFDQGKTEKLCLPPSMSLNEIFIFRITECCLEELSHCNVTRGSVKARHEPPRNDLARGNILVSTGNCSANAPDLA